jgi:uncharacterized protein
MLTMVSASPSDNASVLLTFRGQNVRSFRDEFELSLLATTLADESVPREVPWREGGQPLPVLPAACILGANASGKSNVLRAMEDMRRHVLHSFRSGDPTGGISRRPFLLDASVAGTPSTFEVDLILRGVRHEYGFRIDDERVVEEWAYRYPHGRPVVMFKREWDSVALGATDRGKGRAVLDLLRPNALFLSTAAAANHPTLLPLYEWFGRNLRLAEAASRSQRWAFTTELLQASETRDQVLALLRAADLGITNARTRPFDPKMLQRLRRAVRILAGQEDEPDTSESEFPSSILELGVTLSHRGTQDDIEFDSIDESLGTLVWVGLIGPVVHALAEGAVLLADELEASLHPTLVVHLARLFQDPATNPRRAQLVFNSHEATLLGDSVGERVLGRDQVWFTEKLHDGSTRLYPLTDLNPRKEEAIGRRYLSGRYGATPIVSREEFAAAAELITSAPRR